MNPTSSGKPSPILLLFLIFPVLGIAAALGFALANLGEQAAPPTPLPVTLPDTSLINRPAPNFELPGLDGRSYRLSSFRGQVVFLNFWATWCEPCEREMPAFELFSAGQDGGGAVILAVNNGETLDVIQPFLERNRIALLPVLLDENLAVYDAYNIDRMPTTLVIDPAGVVRYRHLGEMTLEDLMAYVDALSDGT